MSGEPSSGSTFDVNDIYTLGNSWSRFGDILSEQIATMQSAVESFTWSGEGAVAFGMAWDLIHSQALAPLPELAWNIGEEINYYGQQAEAQEEKTEKKETAAALAQIFGIALGAAIMGIGDFMAPLLEGLVDSLTGLLSNVISEIGEIVVRGVATFAGEAAINGAAQFVGDMIGQGLADAIEHVPFTVNWKSEGIGFGIGAGMGLLGLGAGAGKGVADGLRDTPEVADDASGTFVEPLHIGEPDVGAEAGEAVGAGARVPEFGADPLSLKSGEFGALEGGGDSVALNGLRNGAGDVDVLTGGPEAATADGRGVSDAPGPRTSAASADSSVSATNPAADAGRPGAAVDAGSQDVGSRGVSDGFGGEVRQTLGGADSSVSGGDREVDPGRPGAAVGAGPEDVGSRGVSDGFGGEVRQTVGGADSSVTPGHEVEDGGGRPSLTPDAGAGDAEPRAADPGAAAGPRSSVKNPEPPAEPGRQSTDSGGSAPSVDGGARGVEPRSGETNAPDPRAADSSVTDAHANDPRGSDSPVTNSPVTDAHASSSGPSASDAHEHASQRADAGGAGLDPAGQAGHTDQAGHASPATPAAAPPVPVRAAEAGPSRSERWQEAQHELQRQYTDRFDYTAKTELVHDMVDEKVKQAFADRVGDRDELGLFGDDLSAAGRERVLERFQADVKNQFDNRFGTPGHGYDTALDHAGIVARRLDALGGRLSSRIDREALWERQRDLARERFAKVYDTHPDVAPRLELLGPRGAGRVEAERAEAWQQFEPELRKAFDKLADRTESIVSEDWDRFERKLPSETDQAAQQTSQRELAAQVSAKFRRMLRDDAPHGISLRNRLEQELESGRAFTDGRRGGEYGNPPDDVWHALERDMRQRMTSDFNIVHGRPFSKAEPYRGNWHEESSSAHDEWALRREERAGLIPDKLARLVEFGPEFRARFDEAVAARDTTRAELGLSLERPAENPDYGLSYGDPTSESVRGAGFEVGAARTGAEIAPNVEPWRPGRDISNAGLERVGKEFGEEVRTAFEQHFREESLDSQRAWRNWRPKADHFFSISLPRRLEHEAAFERQVGSVDKALESSYERWSNDLNFGGRLDAGALGRVRTEFGKDLRAAYDGTYQRRVLGEVGEWDHVGGAELAWQRATGKLLAGADRRFAAEEDLVRAVREGADGFDAISREFPVTKEHADELASSYRSDLANRHQEIYSDTKRNLTSWLEHEAAHGDGFGSRLTELRDLRQTQEADAKAKAAAEAKAGKAGSTDMRDSEVPHLASWLEHEQAHGDGIAGGLTELWDRHQQQLADGQARAEAGARAGDAGSTEASGPAVRGAEQPARAGQPASAQEARDSAPQDAPEHQDTDSTDREQLLVRLPGPSRAQSSRHVPQGAHEADAEPAGFSGARGPRPYSDTTALDSASRDEAHLGSEPRYSERQYSEPQRVESQHSESQHSEPQHAEPQHSEPPRHGATSSTHSLGEQTVAAADAHDSAPRSFDGHDTRTSGPDAQEQAGATVGRWPETQAHLDQRYAGRFSAVHRIESQRPDAAAVYRRIVDAGRPQEVNTSALVPAARSERDIPESAAFKQAYDAAYDRVWTPVARVGLADGPVWYGAAGRWLAERERLENTLASHVRLAALRLDRADDAVRDAQAARAAWSAQQAGKHDAGLIDEALDAFRDHQQRLFLGTYGRLGTDGGIDPNASRVYDGAYRSLVRDIDGFRDAAKAQRAAQESAGARFDEEVLASAERESGRGTGLELAPLSARPQSDAAARFDVEFGKQWDEVVSGHLPRLRGELVDAVRGGAAFRASSDAVEHARDATRAIRVRIELAEVFAGALPRLRDGVAQAVNEFPRHVDRLAARSIARLVVGRADEIFRQAVADTVAHTGRRADPVRRLRDGLDALAESAGRLLEFEGSLHTRLNLLVDGAAQESARQIGVRVARISSAAAVAAVDKLTAAQRRRFDSADALSGRLRELLDETDQRFAFEAAARQAMAAVDARVRQLVTEPRNASAAALDGDGIQRLRAQHLAAARSAVDQARAELVEQGFDTVRTSEVMARLEGTMLGLAEKMPGRLAAEAELTAGLTEAGDRFGRQAEAYDLPGRALAELAADYRGEWMAARAQAFEIEALDLTSWLDHEREHGNRFGVSAGARIREVIDSAPEDSAETSEADRLFARSAMAPPESVRVEEVEDEQAHAHAVGGTLPAESRHVLEDVPSRRESADESADTASVHVEEIEDEQAHAHAVGGTLPAESRHVLEDVPSRRETANESADTELARLPVDAGSIEAAVEAWRKSTFSPVGPGAACVEVAVLATSG